MYASSGMMGFRTSPPAVLTMDAGTGQALTGYQTATQAKATVDSCKPYLDKHNLLPLSFIIMVYGYRYGCCKNTPYTQMYTLSPCIIDP